MENIKVRELTENDAEIYEEYICEHIALDKLYLTDNFLKNQKKYIEYHNFEEWYKTLSNSSKIYLVFSLKNYLVGSFEICENSAAILIDVRPTQRDRGYETQIIAFIYNTCSLKDCEIDFILSSIPKLPLEKLEESQGIYTYKYDEEKNKMLIKNN